MSVTLSGGCSGWRGKVFVGLPGVSSEHQGEKLGKQPCDERLCNPWAAWRGKTLSQVRTSLQMNEKLHTQRIILVVETHLPLEELSAKSQEDGTLEVPRGLCLAGLPFSLFLCFNLLWSKSTLPQRELALRTILCLAPDVNQGSKWHNAESLGHVVT